MSAHAGAAPQTLDAHRLRVNAITCDAHGMCAELLPEQIALDEWAYPVIGDEQVPPQLRGLARQAVQACPTRALLLERRQTGERPP